MTLNTSKPLQCKGLLWWSICTQIRTPLQCGFMGSRCVLRSSNLFHYKIMVINHITVDCKKRPSFCQNAFCSHMISFCTSSRNSGFSPLRDDRVYLLPMHKLTRYRLIACKSPSFLESLVVADCDNMPYLYSI